MELSRIEKKKIFSDQVNSLDKLLKNMKKYQKEHEILDYLDQSFNEKVELLKQRYGTTKEYVRLKNHYNIFKGIEGS